MSIGLRDLVVGHVLDATRRARLHARIDRTLEIDTAGGAVLVGRVRERLDRHQQRVRARRGHSVAIVAAEHPEQARLAIEAIAVEYELLEPVVDMERALESCAAAGMRTETPPEGWLVKAWDGDVLVASSKLVASEAVSEPGFLSKAGWFAERTAANLWGIFA